MKKLNVYITLASRRRQHLLQIGGSFILQSIKLQYIQDLCFFNVPFSQEHSVLLVCLQTQDQYQMCEILVGEGSKAVLILTKGTRA